MLGASVKPSIAGAGDSEKSNGAQEGAMPSALPVRFEIAGREWIARRVLNEANTRHLIIIRLARKGPPWPSGRSVYRAAKRRAAELLADQVLPHEIGASRGA